MKAHEILQEARLEIRRSQIDYRIEQILIYWLKQYIDWSESYGQQKDISWDRIYLLAFLHRMVWAGEKHDRFKQAALALSYFAQRFESQSLSTGKWKMMTLKQQLITADEASAHHA